MSTRTYYDFPTVSQCMAYDDCWVFSLLVIIDLFEKELIRINPGIQKLSYQVSDIYNYIDSLNEFNMLMSLLL